MDNGDLNWATLIALDPGGTTGWSVMSVHPEALVDDELMILDNVEHWSQGQIYGDDNEQTDALGDLLDVWTGVPVVMERFILRKLLKSEELLSPVRISARVEYLCARGGWGKSPALGVRPWVYQNVDAAKSTATDERLRDWGFYRSDGHEHARDATRHAITMFRSAKSQRNQKLKRYLWPALYGPGAPYGPVARSR